MGEGDVGGGVGVSGWSESYCGEEALLLLRIVGGFRGDQG